MSGENYASEDPKKKPHPHAAGGDSKKKDWLLYLVLAILVIAGAYAYLASKGYLGRSY